MRITVPVDALEHFWEEPPPGSMEFWAFRWKPKALAGDPIYFVLGTRVIATAVVHSIAPPGALACDRTGKFKRLWKVFWTPESFKDLRETKTE